MIAQCVTVPAPAVGAVQTAETDVCDTPPVCVSEPLQPLTVLLCVSPAGTA
jgi:hypothetical protein